MSASEDTVTGGSAYSADDYARAFPAGYEQHFWHRARLSVVIDQLARLDVQGAVLDIGCGPGQYVRALCAAGYDCLGCDPGDVPTDPCLAGRLFPRADLDTLPAEIRARVRVALLLDVIEHLPDPSALLTRLLDRLPGLRAVIVTVPARPELWSALDRRAGHHRRYTRESLAALVEEAGFLVSDVRYMFRLLYPFAWLDRRRTHSRVVSPPVHRTLHACVGRLLATDLHLWPAGVPGTSVLCVARTALAREDGGAR
jgi:SAM-dependent methyltransferase